MLVIPILFLNKVYNWACRFLPNEMKGLVVGLKNDQYQIPLNILDARIIDYSKSHVSYSLDEILNQSKKFYVIGSLHHHPRGAPSPSEQDMDSMRSLHELFMTHFRRAPYFFIYSVKKAVLNSYLNGKIVFPPIVNYNSGNVIFVKDSIRS